MGEMRWWGLRLRCAENVVNLAANMNETFLVTHDNRDAWAAIRGFAYQIDSTIIEWLRLLENENLELEWGEDIDIISRGLNAGEADFRTLVQVKCTDRTVTLRSPEAVQALCSYAEHLKSNPGMRLMFRFLTTAAPSEERPPEPLRSTPGIELWERIRTQAIESGERAAAINSIATFFRAMSIPKSVRSDAWQALLEATANGAQMNQTIDTFQWSTGSVSAIGIEEQVKGLLVEHGFAVDTVSARVQHDRLFVFLMRYLSQPKSSGSRRLSRADLAGFLDATKVDPREQLVLDEVQRSRREIIDALADVKCDLTTVKTGIVDIQRSLGIEHPSRESKLRAVIDEASVNDSFHVASTSLLSWPTRTLGEWIERPELESLYAELNNKDSSCTVLVGTPGCGKSALLAELGKKLQEKDGVLLAVKADLLPKGLDSLVSFDQFLGLKNSLTGSIKEMASKRTVFLLIDQLDALGSLMDLHTQRLDVILKVVHALKGTKNVHILVSCREFDSQYDARFKTIEAHRQTLVNPPWDTVQKLLESKGISTASWPGEIRETMRTPQHLSFFLENYSRSPNAPICTNYQAMLDEVFTQRVMRVQHLGPKAIEACEKVATEMSNSEELWIARSVFDSAYSGQIDRLLAAGILRGDGLRIGFRHQTLFDYARTRAFTSGTQSLSDYVLERQDALFVRSTLWAALQALRSSSASRYHDEFGRLWRSSLRIHVKSMLITFLGQVVDPDLEEVGWLMSTLGDPVFRGKSLIAMTGNREWFNRLRSRLPGLMAARDEVGLSLVARLLAAALAFDRAGVFKLIEDQWGGSDRDIVVLNTVADLVEWDEESVAIVERRVRRTSITDWYVVHVVKAASKSAPGLAPRIIGAALQRSLEDAGEEKPTPYVPAVADDSPLAHAADKLLEWKHTTGPIRELLRENRWYGLEEIVTSVPNSVVEQIWPWFIEIAQLLLRAEKPWDVAYRMSDEFDLRGGIESNHLLNTLRLALIKSAEMDPEAFIKFAQQSSESELELVHRMLAHGYQAIASSRPGEVLKYLSNDPRRLALGSDTNRHRETAMLISAVAPHLNAGEIKELEVVIKRWDFNPVDANDSAEWIARKEHSNREHRLRLMRAFAKGTLSPESAKARAEEEIALPGTPDEDIRVVGGFVRSPMMADEMEKASDDEILTVLVTPRDQFSGNASSDFINFAKKQPDRAVSIMARLRRGEREDLAGLTIHTVSELEKFDESSLVALIRKLDDEGFTSGEFRCWAAWALAVVADRVLGLDETTCAMLRGWIEPTTAEKNENSTEASKPRRQSLLWGPQFGILPRGNYPTLEALLHGYLKRLPPRVDDWLVVLEGHIKSEEDLDVWRALVRNLNSLGLANDVARPARFVEKLVDDLPCVLPSVEGAAFIAKSHQWLPEETTHKCLRNIEESKWFLKGQALGELTMLRLVLVPSDVLCRRTVERALGRLEPGSPYDNDVRLGLAFTATHLWGNPRFREAATKILIPLLSYDEGPLKGAIMEVFRLTPNMLPDRWTEDVLRAIVRNPAILELEGHNFLAERLKELLADGFDPQLVAEVARAILTAGGDAIGDIRTARALDAQHLIEIALTLQRIRTTRVQGLDLFEALLERRAFEVDKVLREIDRRIA